MPSDALLDAVAEALQLNLGQRKSPYGIEIAKLGMQWVEMLEDAGVKPEEVMPAMKACVSESDEWIPIGVLKRQISAMRPPRRVIEPHEIDDADAGPAMSADERREFWAERMRVAEATGELARVQFAMYMMAKIGPGKVDRRFGGEDGQADLRRVGETR